MSRRGCKAERALGGATVCMLSTAQRAPHLDGHDLYGDQGGKGLGMHVVLRAVGVDGALDGEVLEQLRGGWGRGCGGVGLAGWDFHMPCTSCLHLTERGGGKATGRKGARCCAAGPAGSTQQAQAAALSEARQRGQSRAAAFAACASCGPGTARHGAAGRAEQRAAVTHVAHDAVSELLPKLLPHALQQQHERHLQERAGRACG